MEEFFIYTGYYVGITGLDWNSGYNYNTASKWEMKKTKQTRYILTAWYATQFDEWLFILCGKAERKRA